jgi:hypothetical protein
MKKRGLGMMRKGAGVSLRGDELVLGLTPYPLRTPTVYL